MKAEPSRLIPRKATANWELLFVRHIEFFNITLLLRETLKIISALPLTAKFRKIFWKRRGKGDK